MPLARDVFVVRYGEAGALVAPVATLQVDSFKLRGAAA